MWIGVGCVGVAGRRAGRRMATSQEEFMGKLSRNGWVRRLVGVSDEEYICDGKVMR